MADPVNKAFLRALVGQEGTHAHIIGRSGTGKSRFLESLIRDALYEDAGFCVIDYHGTLYDGVLNYLAFNQTDHRPIYLLDVSRGEFITPYNPFAVSSTNPVGAAMSFTEMLVKTWGAQDTTATPRIAQIARALFLTAIVSHEPLSHIALMLRQEHDGVRKWALRILDHPEFSFVRDDIHHLALEVPKARWEDHVMSTLRRLGRLLADPAVFRFLNFRESSIDLRKIMDEGGILLVNLAQRGHLERESAQAFATLLLADLFRTALQRAASEDPLPFILFADEFHEYLSPDTPKMLDAVRKGGLHLVMAHQRLDQLTQDQADVRDAVLQNAGVKVCFRIEDYETARFMARQLFIRELNTDSVKDEIRRWETTAHTLEEHDVETSFRNYGQGATHATGSTHSARLYHDEHTAFSMEGSSDTTGASAFEGHGEASGTIMFLRPILEYSVASRTFYTVQEKENKLAELLMTLEKRRCVIRHEAKVPLVHDVPDVKRYTYDDATARGYRDAVLAQSRSLPVSAADTQQQEARQRFLSELTARKPRQKPTSAPPQIPQ